MNRMKKCVLIRPVKYLQLLIILATGLFWTSTCLSSYLIELKQGNRFVTNNYWEDGNHIKFYLHGGIVGIEKRHIKRIEETTPDNTAEEQGPANQEITQALVEKKAVTKPKTASISEFEAKKNAVLEEKRYLTSEINSLIAAIKKAKEENDKELIQSQRKRLLSLNVELQDLREKVKKENGDKIPEWWNINETRDPPK